MRYWVLVVVAALLAAGFALIALATFDPTLTPSEQQGLTGPVGVWLGWATFQSFGYAGFLLPLLLGGWGASAFLRPIVVRGWVPLAGLGALLIAAAGMLTQATRVRSGAIGGGLVKLWVFQHTGISPPVTANIAGQAAVRSREIPAPRGLVLILVVCMV